jgi:hypothetical protein
MLHDVHPEISGLAFRPGLLAAGLTDDELNCALCAVAGSLRRSVRVPTSPRSTRGSTTRWPDTPWRARAAIPKVAPDAVLSHVSAAVMHGLPLWNVPLHRVHVTRPRSTGGRRTRLLHVHAAPLEPDEITILDDVPLTCVDGTVVDLACMLPFEPALIAADAALNRHLVTPADLRAALVRAAGRSGVPAARRVVAAANARAASPGETRSRLAIARAGLPTPQLQHVVAAVGAEVDFYWEEFQTVGEFDGKVKYGRSLRPGQTPGDVVFAEKRREDALRDEGLQVARWVWDEICPFDEVAARLWRAFARSRR